MKNILISQFYEQFSRNGPAMAPERLFEKISSFKIMNILYISLKHVSGDFEYIITFAKSVFAHIFAKFEYFAKVNIYSKSPEHVL